MVFPKWLWQALWTTDCLTDSVDIDFCWESWKQTADLDSVCYCNQPARPIERLHGEPAPSAASQNVAWSTVSQCLCVHCPSMSPGKQHPWTLSLPRQACAVGIELYIWGGVHHAKLGACWGWRSVLYIWGGEPDLFWRLSNGHFYGQAMICVVVHDSTVISQAGCGYGVKSSERPLV